MTFIYPLVVAVACAVFGAGTWMQYAERHHLHQLFWTISLAMGFLGSLGYVLALSGGSMFWFRVYYLFGAMLMAPFLGLGSVYLHTHGTNRVASTTLWIVIALSIVGTVFLFLSPGDAAALAQLDGGPGTDVLSLSTVALVTLIVLNTFGLVAVAGLALDSAWELYRQRTSNRFFVGNLLLAVGTILVGAAGSLARLGAPTLFWALMAVGFVVLYAGFQVLNAASSAAQSDGG